jgi:hypothetical protein
MSTSPTPHEEYRRSVAHWVWVTLFFASSFATLQIARRTADWAVLRWAYGPELVEREQLRIVSHKPVLQVSNGDSLEQWHFRNFVTTLAIWLPLGIGILFALRWLLPRNLRGVGKALSPDKLYPGLFSALLLPTLILLICLSGSAVACGVVDLVAIAVAWLTAGRPRPPSDPGLDHRSLDLS